MPKQAWHNRIVGTGEESPDQLLANPRNFRVHPKHQQDALEGVLNEVGWVDDVIVNQRTGFVIDGHLRVSLAQRRGEMVPVKYVDLDENEEALILATFDPISALAATDAAQLDALLREVSTSDAAVMQMLSDLAEQEGVIGFGEPEAGLTDPDEVPEPPSDPITKPGDLWILGRHRLLCGDSTNREDVDRLMDGEKADMVFTDPPYAVYGSSTGVGGDTADDKMVRPFFRDIMSACGVQAKANAHIYVCCDFRSWPAWWDIAKSAHIQIKNCIVWDKGTPALGTMFRSQHEFVLFATNSWKSQMSTKSTPQRVVKTDANVWTIPRPSIADKEHNAAKPVELIQRAIDPSSDVGDIVLDLFGGSGSTLIACEQTERVCRMMELDPHYCDVIVQRWENFTGQQAHREAVS